MEWKEMCLGIRDASQCDERDNEAWRLCDVDSAKELFDEVFSRISVMIKMTCIS